MQAQSYRADIAHAIPAGMLPDIADTLERTSRVLGMFEAYESMSQQNERLEAMLETDQITRAVLEDLHDRAAGVTLNAETIIDRGHSDGYVDILRLTMNEQVPQLSELRDVASAVVAEGWTLEEDIPALGFDPDAPVDDPFADPSPDHDYACDEIDF